MRFSVVIPTYNRKDILRNCLDALLWQQYDTSKYEIIVVDDGSSDGTQTLLKEFERKSPVPFSFFSQKNQGQGVARNFGITKAKGEIILFLGDDIYADTQLLKEHDVMHKKHAGEHEVVLGFVTWDPSLTITPLMKFMEQGGALFGRFGGQQFAYDLLEGKHEADYRFFYTANISLKRSLLERFQFDTSFSKYGWEDIELGYRLTKEAGMKLYYAKNARGLHYHPTDFKGWENRMRSVGRSIHIIHQKYPELRMMPSLFKRFIFHVLSSPPSLFLAHILSHPLYFYALSKKYFLKGLKEGYNVK